MTLFFMKHNFDCFDSFQKAINRNETIINSLKQDQKCLPNLLVRFNNTMKAHGETLQNISHADLQLTDMTQLNTISNQYLSKLEELGVVYIGIYDYFKSDLEENISGMENPQKLEEISLIQNKLNNYTKSLPAKKAFSEKKMALLLEAESEKEESQKKLSKVLKNRYCSLGELSEMKKEHYGILQRVKSLQKDYEASLKEWSDDYNTENEEALKSMEEILRANFETNRSILSSYFDFVVKKLSLFSGKLFSEIKRMKHDFNAENEVMNYSFSILPAGGSKDFYLYENLMSEDLEKVIKQIKDRCLLMSQSITQLSEMVSAAYKSFVDPNTFDPIDPSVSSSLTEKLETMIAAIEDVCIYRSSKLKEEQCKHENFTDNLHRWFKRLGQYLSTHKTTLDEIDPSDVKTPKNIPVNSAGFDENFFAALEESSEDFHIKLMDFGNVVNSEEKLFRKMEAELEKGHPSRKRFLQTVEKMLANQVEWQKHSIVLMADSLSGACNESKQVALSLSIPVGSCSVVSGIPSVREFTPEFKEITSRLRGDGQKESKNLAEKVDPAIYERFLGQKEVEKAKSKGRGGMNFFSYLIENFDGEVDETGDGGQEAEEPFRVFYGRKVDPEKEYSHTLVFVKGSTSVKITEKDTNKKKTIEMKEFKTIKFVTPKGNKSKRPNSRVVLNDPGGEVFEATVLGDDEEIDRFRNAIVGIFKNHIQSKNAKSCAVYFKIILQMVLAKKKAAVDDIVCDLSLSIFKNSAIRLNNTLIPTKNIDIEKKRFHKSIAMGYKDSKGKINRFKLLFKSFCDRDTAFSFVLKMCKEKLTKERMCTSLKKNTFKLHLAAFEWDSEFKGKFKAADSFLPIGQDIYVLAVFNAPKTIDSTARSMMSHLMAETETAYHTVVSAKTNGVFLGIFIDSRLRIDMRSAQVYSLEKGCVVSVDIRDNLYFFVLTPSSSFENFDRGVYRSVFEDIKSKNGYEMLSMADNIIWVVNFKKTKNSMSGNKTGKKLWDSDVFNKAVKRETIFENFHNGFYKSAENQDGKDRSLFPLRLLWSSPSSSEDEKDVHLEKLKTLRDVPMANPPLVSAEFKIQPRKIPVNFKHISSVIEKTPHEQLLALLSDLKLSVPQKTPLGDCARLRVYVHHGSAESAFLSAPSDFFDEENGVYRWSEAELVEPVAIPLYLNVPAYLERTALRLVFCGERSEVVGYCSLPLCVERRGSVVRGRVFLGGVGVARFEAKASAVVRK